MGLFFYTKKGSIISTVDLPTTEIIEPIEKGSRVDRTLEPFSIYLVIGRLRKTHMEQLNLITNFLRIKDKNITITDEYDMGTHLELHGHLDYTAPKCPKCKGQMAKYDY